MIQEIIVRILKFSLFLYLLYSYGIIFGWILYILFTYLWYYFLLLGFGYEEAHFYEAQFFSIPPINKYTMTGYFILEKYDPLPLKNMIINKALKNFSRLRKKAFKFLGNYYWREFSLEEATKQVKILHDIHIKDKRELEEYTATQQMLPFKFGDFQYEFQIFRFGENSGALMLKFDHSLSDGIGVFGLLIAMADNYSLDLYPRLHEISTFQLILLYLLSPFYAMKLLVTFSQYTYYNTPYRLINKRRENTKNIIIGNNNFPFDRVSQIAKTNKMTFNDLIVAVINKVTKIIYEKEGFKKKDYVLGISINMRPMPKSLKDHQIINFASGNITTMKLIDDPIKEGNINQKTLVTSLKNPFLIFGSYIFMMILSKITLCDQMGQFMIDGMNNYDNYLSNVPGPKKEIFYNGVKCTDMVVIPTPNCINFFLACVTYAGSFKFTLGSDKCVKIDAREFVDLLEKEIKEILKNNTEKKS